MAKGQAERLFPLLEEVLAEAGLSWSDIDAIGVGIGPGNFTGVRISVAAARGLSLSLGIPAVGVPATEAAACDAARPCRAVVPLRGDEVVWQDFPAPDDAFAASPPRAHVAAATVADGSGSRDFPASIAPAGPGGAVPAPAASCAGPAFALEDGVTARMDHGPAAEGAQAREDAGRLDAPGPRLAKAADLPPGLPVCAPVYPVAVAIARVASRRLAAARGDRGDGAQLRLPRPAPLYLRPADAAPPKDPLPVILQ